MTQTAGALKAARLIDGTYTKVMRELGIRIQPDTGPSMHRIAEIIEDCTHAGALLGLAYLIVDLLRFQSAGCGDRLTCTNHKSCKLLRDAEAVIRAIGPITTDEFIDRQRAKEGL